ncbi:MAG: xanthine dehydrogenase family protein molybdopterin-binding subunit [Acidobacteria bacterium]|nr:xanthine dehydrogenase family protein molybdopterin-binding subunit [Acidobacteriota bacterium]
MRITAGRTRSGKDARLAFFAEMNGAKVVRVVVAFDPGAVLNPAGLNHQIMGATIRSIGGALFERLVWDRQTITTGRLSQYRVPRFSDTPRMDVLLIDRREIEPAGAGESPITIVTPALAGVLLSMDGKRRRKLPLLGNGLAAALRIPASTREFAACRAVWPWMRPSLHQTRLRGLRGS